MNFEQFKKWHRPGERESLAALSVPSTMNDAARTVDIVWFTGIDVIRQNLNTGQFYRLRFLREGLDPSYLNAGAPVLDNHDTESGVAGQKGVVLKAWVDSPSRYLATLRFSRRADVAGIWMDIRDRIIQKFSMGTEILEREDITADGAKQKTILATRWRPYEISMANIPADFGTTTLHSSVSDLPAGLFAYQREIELTRIQ